MNNKISKTNATSITDLLKRMKHLSECNDALIEQLRSNQLLLSYYQRKIDYYTENPTSYCSNVPDNHFLNHLKSPSDDRKS